MTYLRFYPINPLCPRAIMAAIPGKTCGACTMCCKVLEIEQFQKPAGQWCSNCIRTGGCAIYAQRPAVCRDFECQWITDRQLPATMRPDRIGTILMDDPDSDEYHAVCDPAKPLAWRQPLVFKYLVAKAKSGRMVVAKAGLKAWRIYENGNVVEWA
jgi:uncharacterized protein